MTDLDSYVRRRGEIAEVLSDDRVIILALEQERCEPLSLTGSGIIIWQGLTTSFQSIRQIALNISNDLRTPVHEIEPDVIQFLAVLASKGVVQTRDNA